MARSLGVPCTGSRFSSKRQPCGYSCTKIHEANCRLFSMVLSQDGTLLAHGGESPYIYLVDLESGRWRERIRAHQGSIEALVFDRKGATLFSASDDGSIKTWDVDSGRETNHVERAHDKGIFAAVLDERNRVLFTGGLDARLKVWNVKDLSLKNEIFLGHGNGVVSACMTPRTDRSRILHAGTTKGKIFLWHLATNTMECLADAGKGPVFTVKYLKELGILLSGNTGGWVHAWNPRDGTMLWKLQTGQTKVFDILELRGFQVKPSPVASRTLASAGGNGTIKIWRLNHPKSVPEHVTSIKAHQRTVEVIAQQFCQERIFSISSDKSLKSWDFD